MLGEWPHRGNVEKYFKHRYSFFKIPIDNFTEAYAFPDQEAKAVLRDLRRMEVRALSPIEVDIIEGKPSRIEQFLTEQQVAKQRSQAVKIGMQRAQNWGQHIGRPSVGESAEEFLSKPSSQRVIEALEQGLSLRKAAEMAGVAVNTVRKVQKYVSQTAL